MKLPMEDGHGGRPQLKLFRKVRDEGLSEAQTAKLVKLIQKAETPQMREELLEKDFREIERTFEQSQEFDVGVYICDSCGAKLKIIWAERGVEGASPAIDN
ncbi:hypothetical protein KEJ39_06030 [Candidatus Bathyarchaeota archaeon]|nr:hypothetical protein [Candidatus Bathyarchaeota archaeon]